MDGQVYFMNGQKYFMNGQEYFMNGQQSNKKDFASYLILSYLLLKQKNEMFKV